MSHKAENTGGFEACVMSVTDFLIKNVKMLAAIVGFLVMGGLVYGGYTFMSHKKENALYDEWASLESKIKEEKMKKKEEQDLPKFEAELATFVDKTSSFSLNIFPGVQLLEIYDQRKDYQKSSELVQKLLKGKISKEFKQVLQLRRCGYMENLNENAMECYRDIQASSSNTKFAKVEALYALVRISHLNSKPDEAKGYLEELKKLDAQNPIVKEAEYVISSSTRP